MGKPGSAAAMASVVAADAISKPANARCLRLVVFRLTCLFHYFNMLKKTTGAHIGVFMLKRKTLFVCAQHTLIENNFFVRKTENSIQINWSMFCDCCIQLIIVIITIFIFIFFMIVFVRILNRNGKYYKEIIIVVVVVVKCGVFSFSSNGI